MPKRSRAAFWLFVAAMIAAVAGGGAVALLGRRHVAERRGHPDTIAPAQRATHPASPPAPRPDR